MLSASPQQSVSVKSSQYSMYWTFERELMLIKYFEQHRYLWDTDHILFHKRGPRMQGFAELVSLLGIDEATIRQRWSSMRSQFCREERKVAQCSSYIPTWDHYDSLLFLRKPNEEQAEENRQYMQSIVGNGGEDDEGSVAGNGDETGEEEAGNGYVISDDFVGSFRNQEAGQNASGHSLVRNGLSSLMAPITQRTFSRRRLARQQRRINAIYSRRPQHDVVSLASPSPTIPALVAEASRQNYENESFAQYIVSVLARFSADKQRRCRNELLRIVLKYDIGDEEEKPRLLG